MPQLIVEVTGAGQTIDVDIAPILVKSGSEIITGGSGLAQVQVDERITLRRPKATNPQVDAVASTGANLDGIQATARGALDDTGYLTVRKGVRLLQRALKKASTTVLGLVLIARNVDLDSTETDTTRVPNVAGVKRLIERLRPASSAGVDQTARAAAAANKARLDALPNYAAALAVWPPNVAQHSDFQRKFQSTLTGIDPALATNAGSTGTRFANTFRIFTRLANGNVVQLHTQGWSFTNDDRQTIPWEVSAAEFNAVGALSSTSGIEVWGEFRAVYGGGVNELRGRTNPVFVDFGEEGDWPATRDELPEQRVIHDVKAASAETRGKIDILDDQAYVTRPARDVTTPKAVTFDNYTHVDYAGAFARPPDPTAYSAGVWYWNYTRLQAQRAFLNLQSNVNEWVDVDVNRLIVDGDYVGSWRSDDLAKPHVTQKGDFYSLTTASGGGVLRIADTFTAEEHTHLRDELHRIITAADAQYAVAALQWDVTPALLPARTAAAIATKYTVNVEQPAPQLPGLFYAIVVGGQQSPRRPWPHGQVALPPLTLTNNEATDLLGRLENGQNHFEVAIHFYDAAVGGGIVAMTDRRVEFAGGGVESNPSFFVSPGYWLLDDEPRTLVAHINGINPNDPALGKVDKWTVDVAGVAAVTKTFDWTAASGARDLELHYSAADITALKVAIDNAFSAGEIQMRARMHATAGGAATLDNQVGLALQYDPPILKSAEPRVQTGSVRANVITVGVNGGQIVDLTMIANTRLDLALVGSVDGETLLVRVKQDATGNRVLTLNAAIQRDGRPAPVLNPAANALTLLYFQRIGAAWHYLGYGGTRPPTDQTARDAAAAAQTTADAATTPAEATAIADARAAARYTDAEKAKLARFTSVFRPRGMFAVRTAYSVNDIVTYSGHLYYVATAVPDTNTAVPVDGATWVLLSADPTPSATTTREGTVELATAAEMTAGTAKKVPDADVVRTYVNAQRDTRAPAHVEYANEAAAKAASNAGDGVLRWWPE